MSFSTAVLRERIESVEPARLRARYANFVRIGLLAVLGVCALPVLIGGVFGAVWLSGRYIAQSLVLVIVVFLVAVPAISYLLFLAGRRIFQIRAATVPEYEDAFCEQVVAPSLREALPGCRVSAARLEDPATYHGSRLFKKDFVSFEGRILLTGTLDGVPWRCESLQVMVADYSGNIHTRRRTHFVAFRGLLVHLARQRSTCAPLRLLCLPPGIEAPGHRLLLPAAHLQATTGDADFDASFRIIATSRHDPPSVITESLRRACLEAWEELRHPFFVSFNETGLYLAIMTPSPVPLEPTLYRRPRPEELAAELGLMRKLPTVVDAIRRSDVGDHVDLDV
jgi:hypothetical protein